MALQIIMISSCATLGKAAQKSNKIIAGRSLTGGLLATEVPVLRVRWGGGLVAEAVADISSIRALASMSMMLLRPCLPQMNPFCWVSAHWAMAPDMVRLIAAAMVLLSVFLRPRGLVFSAVLLTLPRVSSSAVPFGRKIPSELLKPEGGSLRPSSSASPGRGRWCQKNQKRAKQRRVSRLGRVRWLWRA
jgi:hypothetical protein